MEETTLERALNDIKLIRNAIEVAALLGNDEWALDAQAWIVFDARESLVKHLNASLSLLPRELHQLFKHSAMLLIAPGVRRGFIDSSVGVDVLCQVARAEGAENPDRERYTYKFSSEVECFAVSQMSGEQLYALFLSDITENASDEASYKNRLEFDRNVAEKVIAVLYVVAVAWRVFRSEDGQEGDENGPPSRWDEPGGGTGQPDGGGSGVPKVPITPTLIGAAANEIPREEEDDAECVVLSASKQWPMLQTSASASPTIWDRRCLTH